jgi:nucleotide-binding universal stress UspA family protein
MAPLILIATDGSPPAQQATAVGLDLALAQGADVLFVHFSPLAASLFEDDPREGPSQQMIEDADPVLRAAAEQARARGLRFELDIADEHGTSDIAAAIAGIAEGKGAAFIVVGTRGRGAVTSAILGSVTHGLLNVSPVPVVVTHAAQAVTQT